MSQKFILMLINMQVYFYADLKQSLRIGVYELQLLMY